MHVNSRFVPPRAVLEFAVDKDSPTAAIESAMPSVKVVQDITKSLNVGYFFADLGFNRL